MTRKGFRRRLGRTIAGAAVCLRCYGFSDGVAEAEADSVYIQSGDVAHDQVVVWGRCNREERADLAVRFYPTNGRRKAHAHTVWGPEVDSDTDQTGQVHLRGLRPGTDYSYYVICDGQGFREKSLRGRVKTAPAPDHREQASFVWIADLAGQGWGQTPELSITDKDGDEIEGG